jgi:hypothetical protein
MAASALDWAKEDKRKPLHVVYRVGDLQVPCRSTHAVPCPSCPHRTPINNSD